MMLAYWNASQSRARNKRKLQQFRDRVHGKVQVCSSWARKNYLGFVAIANKVEKAVQAKLIRRKAQGVVDSDGE
jgi:hypothetical protein